MGPSVSILLPTPVTEANRASLEVLFDRLGSLHVGADTNYTAIIESTKPIGGKYDGEGRLLDGGWWEGEAYPGEDEDWPTRRADLERFFGFSPVAGLWLGMGVNQRDDHRILGEVACHVSRLLGGIISFHGALLPTPTEVAGEWPWRGTHVDLPRIASRTPPATDQLLPTLPGKIIALAYHTAAGRTAVCHVGDAEFMASWLKHPEFHLVK
jgi:uncharacterized protein DUF6368